VAKSSKDLSSKKLREGGNLERRNEEAKEVRVIGAPSSILTGLLHKSQTALGYFEQTT